jgi:magnesium transporter
MDDPFKTPVTFILTSNFVVSVRYAELTSFKLYQQQAMKKGGVQHALAEAIMLDMLEAMTDRIAESLEDLGNEIDGISGDIFRGKRSIEKGKRGMLQFAIRKVGAKGETLNMLRESLATISRLLSHHYTQQLEDHEPSKIVRQKMQTLNRDVDSLNDHAAFLSGKMNFLLDATLGMINLEQNQIIKIFSIAAVVFLPPTLVASVYGMNFRHMPELEWVYGYPYALGLMVVVAILPLLFFKKKGWL